MSAHARTSVLGDRGAHQRHPDGGQGEKTRSGELAQHSKANPERTQGPIKSQKQPQPTAEKPKPSELASRPLSCWTPPPHWFFIGERRRDPHLYLGEAERTALRLAPPPPKSFQGLVLAGTVSLWSRGRILPVQPTGGPPVYRACLRLLIRSHAVH